MNGAIERLAETDARERLELIAWRMAGRSVLTLVERVLAAQGDRAEPELVKLQHALADLVTLSNPTQKNHETAR